MSGPFCPKIEGDNLFEGIRSFKTKKNIFCTCADGKFQNWFLNEIYLFLDGVLRIYDATIKKEIKNYKFYHDAININLENMENKYIARALDVHPDKNLIIVGFLDGNCASVEYDQVRIKKFRNFPNY